MTSSVAIIKVVVASPLKDPLDYLADGDSQSYPIGIRVVVPFGRRKVIGIVVGSANSSNIPEKKLKVIESKLDLVPLISDELMWLYRWVSRYYHYPLGDVILRTLPKMVRDGASTDGLSQDGYCLSDKGRRDRPLISKKSIKQRMLLDKLSACDSPVLKATIKQWGISSAIVQVCSDKGWLEVKKINVDAITVSEQLSGLVNPSSNQLTTEQQHAVDLITGKIDCFSAWLLHGITGSGKTEVYLHSIFSVLEQCKQVLVLVPEILLTPQTVSRFEKRFNVPVVSLHSGLTDKQRYRHWLQVRKQQPLIVIGTRSAIFAPFYDLGMIVIDEEHDLSFKQQVGLRYSARDLAVVRAKHLDIPVILGSATPSFESLYNVEQERFSYLALTQRVGGGCLPAVEFIDMRDQKMQSGLSAELVDKMQHELNKKGQVLVFLNRRGYAPAWMCHHCGYVVSCTNCDTRMVVHVKSKHLRCHHCQSTQPLIDICTQCSQADFIPVGMGTERLVQAFESLFSSHRIVRVDRDTVRSKKAMQDMMDDIATGDVDIIVGTQMMSKGHHFPRLSMVVIVDADNGLYSLDFRATERMAQQLLQVSGRAARESAGKVLIQTHYPDHQMFKILYNEGYYAFYNKIKLERQRALLPPFVFHAVLHAEAKDANLPLTFLEQTLVALKRDYPSILSFGPAPSLMVRRSGMYRYQLLIQSDSRQELQQQLMAMMKTATANLLSPKCRWQLDVDPLEM